MRFVRYLTAALLFSSAGVAMAQDDRATEVRCTDGTLSYTGPEACVDHGGIVTDDRDAAKVHNPKADLASNPPLKPNQPLPKELCRDGTYAQVVESSATCSGHAGVAK